MKIAEPVTKTVERAKLYSLWKKRIANASTSNNCSNVFQKRSMVACTCVWTTLNGCFGKGGNQKKKVTAVTGGVDLSDATCKYLCLDLSALLDAIETSHKKYYAATTTMEERITIEINLSAQLCQSFVPSTKQTNYWTYVTPTGEEKMSLCSEGLCELLGGKTKAVNRAKAEEELDRHGIVFFKNDRRHADSFRSKSNERFKSKFTTSEGEDEAVTCKIFTPVGCLFTRLLDKNGNPDSAMVMTRQEETVNMIGGYLVGARKVHINHKAVKFLFQRAIQDIGIFQWDYSSTSRQQKEQIENAGRKRRKLDDELEGSAEVEGSKTFLKSFGTGSQTFASWGTVNNQISVFREELTKKHLLLRRVMILEADAKYPNYQCEDGHYVAPFLSKDGHSSLGCRIQLQAGVPWVDNRCIAYEKVELTQENVEREAGMKTKRVTKKKQTTKTRTTATTRKWKTRKTAHPTKQKTKEI